MKDKKALLILIPFLLFVIIIGAFAIVGDRIPDNPPETVGNTAGNLNNSGYFCEYDGKVYFANVYDSDTLYSMDPSEQDIKKLGNASVQNILAGGKFLYYYQTGASGDAGIGALRTVRSFNRCKLNGSDVTGLTRDPISTAQLVGSNLYIMTVDDNGPLFYRMKIDKSDKTELANFEINPASAVNGTTIISMPWIPPRTESPRCGTATCGIPSCRGITSTIWMWKMITACVVTPCPGMRSKS